jgi:hypothetical protein
MYTNKTIGIMDVDFKDILCFGQSGEDFCDKW